MNKHQAFYVNHIDSTLYYVLKDHLGSASVVTDSSGNPVGEDRFYPFGETRLTTGSIFTDKLFTGQREMAGYVQSGSPPMREPLDW